MKIIEVDEELYQFIASNTQSIGESASDILRRLLHLSSLNVPSKVSEPVNVPAVAESAEQILEKSAADVKIVETKKTEAVVTKEDELPQKVATKKQSDEVIARTVDKLRKLFDSEDFLQETKAVVRFLSILTVLYRTNPEGFALATESLQGRTRVYFARDEGTLLMAGNHTKPKQIPETPYWVITNNNSGRKLLMLEGAMSSMHLPDEIIDDVRKFFVVN
ncbi:negative regulator of replication initiation SeqA [Cricetibacter osteomyelitidis]|uniref:Negative modulator of initiation of replication n=1 Tax=Cricetibacter osteomyelitidis TaxID=1521931 RepID=A0A4R2T3W0_9PAST|nr:replication initiation negative regulator SeqA [Cricetibacter osteomyelitidis]TCP97667.1 negative regulator of replication initiation SeqA [Cricetibacter osteomyelitidis]